MMVIDGSQGEGGGQVLRTSLALALVTGKTFRIKRIRAGRKKPGLMRQHLTAVTAAARVGNATVTGGELGSQDLTFVPGTITPGTHTFAVGTAGSCTLVLQTVLPALLTAGGPSNLVLEGGTHNPMAPPFNFLERTYLPLVHRMGPAVTATLERAGFYPAGGGRFRVDIEPVPRLAPVEILERGGVQRIRAHAMVAKIPVNVGTRELEVVRKEFDLAPDDLCLDESHTSPGPGNTVSVEVASSHITEVFTGFGQKDVRAEVVAQRTVDEVRAYLDAGVPVGNHLADQLMLLLAIAGGGTFRTLAPSSHCRTNADVIGHFLDTSIRFEQRAENDWLVRIGS